MKRILIVIAILAAVCTAQSCSNTGDFADRSADGSFSCPPNSWLGDNGAGRPVCWQR